MTERLHFHFSLSCIREGKWQPTPMFLPGESQGQWSLVGCCLWGCTESDTTEATQQQPQQQQQGIISVDDRQPTPVFLPGESQGQWSLVGCHLWGRTELDTTEATQQQQQQQDLKLFRNGGFRIHFNDIQFQCSLATLLEDFKMEQKGKHSLFLCMVLKVSI